MNERTALLGGSTLAVAIVLVLMPLVLPSSTLATEILMFAMAVLALSACS